MHVGFTIYGQSFVFGKHFRPKVLVTGKSPVVDVETPPENRAAFGVQILLRDDTFAAVICHVHHADCIILFPVDRNVIPPHDIQQKRFVLRYYGTPVSGDITLLRYMRFIAAVIFAEPPIIKEGVAVEKCVVPFHSAARVAFRQDTTVVVSQVLNCV